jgi:hypothetical protein
MEQTRAFPLPNGEDFVTGLWSGLVAIARTSSFYSMSKRIDARLHHCLCCCSVR